MIVKKEHSLQVLAIVLVILGVGLSLGALRAVDSGPARDLTIVARNMAFFVDDNLKPNPWLDLQPGERIVLTFINQDRGMQHDLRFPELNLGTRLLDGDGSAERLVFRVPGERRDTRYTCSIHPIMMTGPVSIR